MSYVLCIDSSVDHASVALAKDEQLLKLCTSENQKEHAAFLQPAIQTILKQQGIAVTDLSAVGVTSGPGSYTGLRVSMATAKGLCYAADVPLITASTTYVMAHAAVKQINKEETAKEEYYLCPMIDARRMEVFTALYNHKLEELQKPHPLIVTEHTFSNILPQKKVYFFGNGAQKINQLPMQPSGTIISLIWNAADMITIVNNKLKAKDFSSVAYSVPEYNKSFHG